MTNDKPGHPEGPREGCPWLNLAKIVLLVMVLVAVWFLLERLIVGK